MTSKGQELWQQLL